MRNTGKKLVKKTDEVLSREALDIGPSSVPAALLGDLRSLIESARIRVAVGVNAEMVLLLQVLHQNSSAHINVRCGRMLTWTPFTSRPRSSATQRPARLLTRRQRQCKIKHDAGWRSNGRRGVTAVPPHRVRRFRGKSSMC